MENAGLPRATVVLSWAVVALAAAASIAGLLWRDLYRDAEVFVDAGWLGNDAVTLTLAVPTLAVATVAAGRSARGFLVWMGAMSFMVYNYAFYLFGAQPNRMLLGYVVLVALSLLSVLIGIVRLPRMPAPAIGTRRFLVAYMTVWAAGLALLWGVQAAAFVVTGEAPELNGSGHAFRVTAALDMTLVVPYVFTAVVLLAQNSERAVAVAGILNVKGILYPLVLLASSYSAHRAGVDGALTLIPLWSAFVVLSSIACWLLLRRSP